MPDIFNQHWNDEDGNPRGGVSCGRGFTISWQHGPLGRGVDRAEPNGAFVEDVLRAVKGRLEHYQESKFNCAENAMAIGFINNAIEELCQRTARREAQGTEGTLQGR